MNEVQEVIFEIICKIATIPNVSKYRSTVLYGLTNYIARYSLMNDYYFISEKAKNHIIENNWSLNPLARGKKSIKNGFTYEHLVPSSFVTTEILINPSRENIKQILIKTDFVAIITQDENKNINLQSNMPIGWKIGDDVWVRYKDSNIKILDEKIKMDGVAKR